MIESLLEIKGSDSLNYSEDEDFISDEFKFLETDFDFTCYRTVNEKVNDHWHAIAIESLTSYFGSKSFHCGGPIPDKLILTDRNIFFVRDVYRFDKDGFGKIVDEIFRVLHKSCPLRHKKIDLQKPWDTIYVIKLFREIQSYYIPKEFVPAMVLLNLKYCKGYDVSVETIDKLNNINS